MDYNLVFLLMLSWPVAGWFFAYFSISPDDRRWFFRDFSSWVLLICCGIIAGWLGACWLFMRLERFR